MPVDNNDSSYLGAYLHFGFQCPDRLPFDFFGFRGPNSYFAFPPEDIVTAFTNFFPLYDFTTERVFLAGRWVHNFRLFV
jgi:hypothetical protein